MGKPKDFVGKMSSPLGGVVYTYQNDTGIPQQCEYACVTAPGLIECTVKLNGEIVDFVYAGTGSHSWWTAAGGRLTPRPIQPDAVLEVSLSGIGAFRIDWPE